MLAASNKTELGYNRVDGMDQEENQEVTNVGAGGRVDADELRRAGQRLLAVLDELSPAAQKPIELMRTLYASTVNYLDAGVSVSDAQFTADELNAAIKGQPEGTDSAEVAARYVRSNANSLATRSAEKREEIDRRLRASGEYHRVVVQKTESRGRHKSYYFLGLEPIDHAGDRELTRDLPAGHIRYRVAQTPKPISWAKPLMRIDLGGRSLSKYLYVAALSLFIVGAIPLIVAPFTMAKLLGVGGIVNSLVVLGLIAATFAPFYMVIDRSIVMAPFWLLRLDVQYAQIEIRATDRIRASGVPLMKSGWSICEGSCPVCQASVDVRRGKREFAGRLVGLCDRSPRGEHCFSFDHVTKVGVPLRANGYFGPIA